MKTISKIIAACLVCALYITGLSSCKASSVQQSNISEAKTLTNAEKKYGVLYGGKPYTLRIDLNTILPTINSVATEQASRVFQSTQILANRFTEMFPNVTIEWDRTKGTDWPYWMTTQLASETAPDICFLQGSQYAEKGWFLRLNEYIDQPNVFIEKNTSWRSMFPDYLWENYLTTDAAGNNVAVPLLLYPGAATAYYYNKDIFKELNLTPPTEWKDFVDMCKKINAAGYVAVAPWSGNVIIGTGLWDIQFSLGPTFSNKLIGSWDFDNSKTMSQTELLRAAYNGEFYLSTNKGGMEMYNLVKEKYTDVLQEGAANTDYEDLWLKGKVAMMEDGLWRLPVENSNTNRKFEFGLFPVPIATSKTSSYAADVEYGKGPYNPPICESYQLVKQTVDAKGEGAKEVCIRFIQWLTVPENLDTIVIEGNGAYIGAVKGTTIPASLTEWFSYSFPRLPNSQWVMWPSADSYLRMSKQFEMYVRGMIEKDVFIKAYDNELKKGIESQIKGLNIDTTQWTK